MRRRMFLVVGSLVALVGLLWPSMGVAGPRSVFPDVIPLPNGFQPEGVVTGRGPTLYAGSLANGAIYEVNLRTGQGMILVPGEDGRVTVGLSFDQRTNYIFAAGGGTGQAYVFDADTGATVATYQVTNPGTFVNDVIVTKDAAYFTNSFLPVIYRLPLGPGGQILDGTAVETIPLGEDFGFVPGAFNANGIEATQNGKYLIIVNSTLGALYRFDTQTREVEQIDLGGATVMAGDGLLLTGRTLYVVQNRLNRIAVVRLSGDLASGEVVDTITDTDFAVPTTVARFGGSLYAVNARFGTPPTPDTEYSIVKVSRHAADE